MMSPSSRRGRPKGTGIDDSCRIARLAELLRVHPELRPTTALRVMGFTDPSAVRRLRDKYKAFVHSASTSVPANSEFVSMRIPRTAELLATAANRHQR